VPRYLYLCRSCNASTEAVHSYREKLSECKKCGDENGLQKDLSTPITTRASMPPTPQKVGATTKEAIEEAREQVKVAKKQLKKRRKNK